jgi:methylmalonyl-CoA mutase C-terminal domain/subunit
MALFPKVVELLAARDAAEVVVFGGGVIPEADVVRLLEAGLAAVFTPGTPLSDITAWVDRAIPAR